MLTPNTRLLVYTAVLFFAMSLLGFGSTISAYRRQVKRITYFKVKAVTSL